MDIGEFGILFLQFLKENSVDFKNKKICLLAPAADDFFRKYARTGAYFYDTLCIFKIYILHHFLRQAL